MYCADRYGPPQLCSRPAHRVSEKAPSIGIEGRSAVDCSQSVFKEAAHDAAAVQNAQHLRTLLALRLERQGVEKAQLAGFFRELAKLLSELPDATLPTVNARLHYLGWRDVTLDYHSMQLAAFCLEDR
jgi:hypothetical protein